MRMVRAWCAWCPWCAHPAATEEAALVALAEHTTMLTDAVGGLSTLMADWVLVREGQRVAAEGALLEQRLHVLWRRHVRSPRHSAAAANSARLDKGCEESTRSPAVKSPERNPPSTPDTQNLLGDARLKYARETTLGPTSNLHPTRHPTRQRSCNEYPSLPCVAVQQCHESGLRFACSPGSTRWTARVAHTRASGQCRLSAGLFEKEAHTIVLPSHPRVCTLPPVCCVALWALAVLQLTCIKLGLNQDFFLIRPLF